ncbi:hypothetical protein BJX70DRAFT_398366 [Aspergillus crustosus]
MAAASPSPSVANTVAQAASELVDFPHYKELQKTLRNNVKKLNATAKVDAIIAENPGKTLDELVANKKINTDQRAQALKKPALQTSVTQLEEQIAHYKEFAVFYEQRLASQRAELEKVHEEELESLREKTTVSEPSEVPEVKKEDFNQQLLRLSKFLAKAALIRHSGDDASPESRAFEGVLFQIYGGSLDAVASMQKLIDGVDEQVVGVDGVPIEVTYAKVKQLAEELASAETPAAETEPLSDPTTANAAYTELQDLTYVTEAKTTDTAPPTETDSVAPPPQTLVSDGANAVADSAWEAHGDPLASSTNTDGFVEIPRDPAETDTGLHATPGNITEDVAPETVAAATKPAGDEFKSVNHQRQPSFRGRGRGRGRGGEGFRGRGRGDYRGRGRGRGGGGGRGRGGPNGAPAATPAPQ